MNTVLKGESSTLQFGARLFECIQGASLIYLHGDLGAGKTTCVRGYLNAGGYTGPVKSPTFTLVEEYQLSDRKIVHFDLYRLADPEELEWIGLRDYLDHDVVCFIEWPEKGTGYLPNPDLIIRFDGVRETRNVSWRAQSEIEQETCRCLKSFYRF